MKQVNKDHYEQNYDVLETFISYYYQTKSVTDLKVRAVLEIGVGTKTTSSYLKNRGIRVTTLDIDKELRPDKVGDIRSLPFKNNSFDCVIAFEVLEHIPFEDLDMALKEISRVTKKYAIISIPKSSSTFELILKFPLIERLFNRKFIDLSLSIPHFYKKHRFDGQHYWELGKKGCPLSKVRKRLNKNFFIKREIRPVLNSYHHFFILEKKR